MAHLVRAALGDAGAHRNERRPSLFLLGGCDRLAQRLQVGSVVHRLDVPAIAPETIRLVRRAGQVRAALDRDAVVIEEPDQPPELLMSGDGGRFMRNPFHEVAVRADRPGVVPDHVVSGTVVPCREPALGHCHADGVRDPLPERPRGGLDARSVSRFGVPGRARPPLAEIG